MKHLKHFGAAGTVTGSCHLLVGDNDRGLLVDMGMFQGPSTIWDMNFTYPTFNAQEIDNVLLTHAHLDHCGRLPLLSKMGFTGTIYATEATRSLAEIVMFDSAKIQGYEDNDNPLYTAFEVEDVLSRMKVVNYDTEFMIDNYKIVYRDAGHLLGSASIKVTDTTTQSDTKSVVFSGDLGNTPDILLRPTELYDSADVVVMESTYGDRVHPKDDGIGILEREINAADHSNSVLMIPAFSLERTQMLLYMIKCLQRENKIKSNMNVYLDSPMGISATAVYEEFVDLYNPEIQKEFEKGDPFSFPGLVVTRSGKQSKRIERAPGKKVIIAGSGMMTGGRIVGHASRYLGEAKNRILFVGYQGEETLGREIKEGATEVQIEDVTVPVNATVTKIENLSAHGDQTQLMNWVSAIKNVKKVVLIHGEDDARAVFAQKISSELPVENVYTPHMEETVTL